MPYSVALATSALALVVAALTATWVLLHPAPKHRHTGLTKRLNEIEMELIECLDRLDKLTVVAKRKYARDVARTKAKPEELSDADWLKEQNRKLAQRKIGGFDNAN